MNDILRFIGLANKAGHLQIGEEPVSAASRAHTARLLLTASDAADNTKRRATRFQETGKAVLIRLPFTKAELGEITGRSSCAMLAVTDIGFASSLADKLEALEPGKHKDGADQLRLQLQRANQRRKERKRHEDKLRSGGPPRGKK